MSTLMAPRDRLDHEVFNVGAQSHNCTQGDLASMLAEAVPGATIQRVPTPVDQIGYAVDFTKIAGRLGFRPTRPLHASIEEIRDRTMEQMGNDWKRSHYHNVIALAERG